MIYWCFKQPNEGGPTYEYGENFVFMNLERYIYLVFVIQSLPTSLAPSLSAPTLTNQTLSLTLIPFFPGLPLFWYYYWVILLRVFYVSVCVCVRNVLQLNKFVLINGANCGSGSSESRRQSCNGIMLNLVRNINVFINILYWESKPSIICYQWSQWIAISIIGLTSSKVITDNK